MDRLQCQRAVKSGEIPEERNAMNAKDSWNSIGEQAKERFLVIHGFKTGWSSHTWSKLDLPIQCAFEKHLAIENNKPATP